MRSAISSRSFNERYRPERAFAEDLNIAGGMPPAFRNNLLPTGCDNPASSAASSLLNPAAIARQNLFCSSRPATEGRPGDGNGARPDRADLRLTTFIATSKLLVLRRPFESAQYASTEYRQALQRRLPAFDEPQSRLLRQCPPMESFFHTLKTELIHHRQYETRNEAERDIFAYIEGFYNHTRRHSAIGSISPVEMELKSA
ncbi:putative transposase [Bradyrhizobium sp. GM22.5]